MTGIIQFPRRIPFSYFVSLLVCIFASGGRIDLGFFLYLYLLTDREVIFNIPEFSREIQKKLSSSYLLVLQHPNERKSLSPQKSLGMLFRKNAILGA